MTFVYLICFLLITILDRCTNYHQTSRKQAGETYTHLIQNDTCENKETKDT